jgi:uncharacterized delta-60 repeat protein
MKTPMSLITNLTGAVAKQARKLSIPAIVALLVFCPLLNLADAAAGDLDLTFGDEGKVVTDFFGSNDSVNALAVQSDGKIVAAGQATLPNNESDFVLARYNSNGALDPTFGSGGKINTDFSGTSDRIEDMIIQPDGKILVAGASFGGNPANSNPDFALARYNNDGSLDLTFGSGGLVRTNMAGFDNAKGIAIQPDGKIVAAGETISSQTIIQRDFALARYNSDGSLDTTFGSGGKVITNFFGDTDLVAGLVIKADGRIVVAGTTSGDVTNFNFALAGYNSDGSLDATFGSGGKVITDFFGNFDVCSSINLQSDGKLVLTGDAISPFFGSILAIARYNSDGSLDATFGNGGKSDANVRAGSRASLILPNGKIIAAGLGFDGTTILDFAVVRYNSDGSLDTTFGNGGKMTANFSGNISQADAVALQPDGKIVLAGLVVNDQFIFDFALARFDGDGPSFDTCIQDDGSGNIFQFNSTTGDYQFTNCTGLTTAGTGIVTHRGSLITLEYTGPDRRVLVRFTSSNRATATIQLFSPRTTFTIMDRNTANNTCACR